MSDGKLTADRPAERLYNGLIKENPTFVLLLGMCPTLAVTTSAVNGLGMGLTTTVVLMLSNLIISLLRKVIPGRVRIPAFIVIIASFVTMVQLLLEAYIPSLNQALGMYIPLIVVNCIILGRAESYAYSHSAVASLFDGLGMGLGFAFALTCIGAVREILGAGSLFGAAILPESFMPILIFRLAPGAFFVLAGLTALQNVLRNRKRRPANHAADETLPAGCVQDCTACGVSGCSSHGKFYDEAYADKRQDNEVEKKNHPKADENRSKDAVRTGDESAYPKEDSRPAKDDHPADEDELMILDLEEEES